MSPKWYVCLLCLMLLMPVPVSSQVTLVIRLVRAAVCTSASGVFVLTRCALRERIGCRILAFQLQLVCQTYPCINFGAPSHRKCAVLPFGCPPWHYRPLGLCQPLRVCCNRWGPLKPEEGSSIAKTGLSRLLGSTNSAQSYESDKESAMASANSIYALMNMPKEGPLFEEVPAYMNITQFDVPPPEEYMKNWPENEDDPVVLEKAIIQHYEKFMLELNAINKQETELGRGSYRIPSFEEFRSVALAETPLKQ